MPKILKGTIVGDRLGAFDTYGCGTNSYGLAFVGANSLNSHWSGWGDTIWDHKTFMIETFMYYLPPESEFVVNYQTPLLPT